MGVAMSAEPFTDIVAASRRLGAVRAAITRVGRNLELKEAL